MPHLRQVLSGLGVTVLGMRVAVPKAHEAIAADGSVADDRAASSLRALAVVVADAGGRLKNTG